MRKRIASIFVLFAMVMTLCSSFFVVDVSANRTDDFTTNKSISTNWGKLSEILFCNDDMFLQKDLYLDSELIYSNIIDFCVYENFAIVSSTEGLIKINFETLQSNTIVEGYYLYDLLVNEHYLYAINDNGMAQLIVVNMEDNNVTETNYTNVNSFRFENGQLQIDMKVETAELIGNELYVTSQKATKNASNISIASDGLENIKQEESKNTVSLMSVNDSPKLNAVVLMSAIQPALFVMDTLYVTQGAYGSYSHSDDNAFDLDGSLGGTPAADVKAPFDGTVKYRETSYNAVWFQSNNIVQYANGNTGYMTVLFMHDNDISNVYVGQPVSQGQVFYQEGGKGPSGANQYGIHLHLECMSGQVGSSGWGARGNVYPNDALYLLPSTNVSNKGGYTWRTWNGEIHKDEEKPTISNAHISNVSGNSFDINCDLSDNVGVTRVWLNVYGPSGSNGYEVSAWNGHFSHTINTANYGGPGTYSVHIYAFDGAGNESPGTSVTNIVAKADSESPIVQNLYVTNVSSNSFTINCDGYDNVGVTRAWINVFGPGGSNGFAVSCGNHFTHTINTADYGGRGNYTVHVYLFDKEGNESDGAALRDIAAVTDSQVPTILKVWPSNVNSNSFIIHCDAYDNVGVTKAWLNVYGPNGHKGFSIGYNDFPYSINTSEYGGAGYYSVHVYAFDADGNESSGYALSNFYVSNDSTAPIITDLHVSNISDQSFTINCTANEKIVRGWVNIYGPNGSDGYSLYMYDDNFMHTIDTSKYGGHGSYEVHVYVWDVNGNESAGKSTGRFVAEKHYTISYNANGGENAPSPQVKIHNENLVLSNAILTRPGYVFWGWAENNPNATTATYPAGGIFTGNYSTTLYAVWKLADYTVTFNATGGTTPIANKTVTYKSSYGTLPTPVLKEHKFKGWFTAPNGGTQITSNSTVLITDNQTLYAQWEYIEPHTETIIYKNGNTLTVSTNLFSITSGKIIACGYKSRRLIDFAIKDYSSDKEAFELTGDIDTVKVMVWDGLNSLRQLTEAEVIPQSEWIIE